MKNLLTFTKKVAFLVLPIIKEGLKVALKVEFLGKLADCTPAKTAPERVRIEQIRVIN